MKQNRSWKWVVVVSVTVLFSGCFNRTTKTDVKIFFPDNTWNRFSVLDAKFEITNIDKTYEVAVNLGVFDGFELDEVPLEIVITAPDGQENILNRTMVVKNDGKYLGNAYGDVWTTKLVIYTEKEFSQVGTYSIFIQNRTQYYDLYKAASLEFTVRPIGKVKKTE